MDATRGDNPNTSSEAIETIDAREADRPVAGSLDGESSCARAHALLAAGLPSLSDDAFDELCQHLDGCDACQEILDATVPPWPDCPNLGPAADEPGDSSEGDDSPAVAALMDRLQTDIQLEVERITSELHPATTLRAVERSPRRHLATHSRRRPFDVLGGHLLPGQALHGGCYRFVIRALVGVGDFTETYSADCQRLGPGPSATSRRAVVKIPRLSADLSDEGARQRLVVLSAMLCAYPIDTLASMRHLAPAIDRGGYVHRYRDQALESTFIAYEFVEGGTDLSAFLEQRGPDGRPFRGVTSVADFARWARQLTSAVLELHEAQVIHGDICPRNVLVAPSGAVVLVDVGQYMFREVLHSTPDFASFSFRAPEGVRTLSSDLYSLGGVLYFLATGRDPSGIRDCTNIEMLKTRIADKLSERNPALFHEDPGVADIIAMCLRSQGRVRDAAQLLLEIETLWPTSTPLGIRAELARLIRPARRLAASPNALFPLIGGVKLRALGRDMLALADGRFDVSGPTEDIRRAAYALLGTLQAGDEFDTVTLPAFWLPRNIGSNGRFLTMCRNAAARGATVRRVFLIDETYADEHLQGIVSAQLAAVASLDAASRPRFAVRYWPMSVAQRDAYVAAGRHFGLLVKEGAATSMTPVYDAHDTLVSLRFRSCERDVRGLVDTFNLCWAEGRPLDDLPFAQRFGRARSRRVAGSDSISKSGGTSAR